MKNTVIYIYLIFIILSCSAKSQEVESTKNLKVSNSVDTDTLFTVGNQVIFYRPSEKEFEILAESESSEGLYEVDSDFGFYSSKVYDLLKGRHTIVTKFTEKKVIGVIDYQGDTTFLNRSESENLYGVVLNFENKKPKIYKMVMTDVELIQLIESEYQ